MNPVEEARIGILGAGTWGIALAKLLAVTGKNVTVWSALPAEIEALAATNVHPKLPGVQLPENISYTVSLEEACTGKDLVVFAVPSIFIRNTARAAREFIPHDQIVVSVAKGIEASTLYTMTEIIDEELAGKACRLVSLSGPTHAEEVAREMYSAIVSSSEDTAAAEYVQQVFAAPFMRVYTGDDPKGSEVCGALKNVIALASGIANGLGCGSNAQAALITRGLAEMKRMGTKFGCKAQTFEGLTGMGDLIVTCTSAHSRNNQCGKFIGEGYSVKEATEKVGMVVEGLNALPAAMKIAKSCDVDMPLVFGVNAIVNDGMDPKQVISMLYERDMKSE